MLLAVGRHCGVILPTSAVTYVFILYSESRVLSLTVDACRLQLAYSITTIIHCLATLKGYTL